MADPLSREDYQAQIVRLEAAIAAQPTCLSHYWQLGLAWLLLRELETAQEIWFAAFAQLAPESLESAMAELIELLQQSAIQQFRQGQYATVEHMTQQILELDDSNENALELLGDAIAQQGRFEEAIACWQSVMELQPSRETAYFKQAEVCERLGNWEGAIALYETLLSDTSEEIQPGIHYQIARCLGEMGRWEEALLHWRSPQPHLLRSARGDYAYALLQLGDFQGAIALLQQTAKQCPDFVEACLQLAETSPTKVGCRNAELLRSLQQSNDVEFYQALGDLFQQKGEYQQASLAYQLAIQQSPDNAENYLKLSQSLRSLQQFEEAKTACQTYLNLCPNSASGYLELGRTIATAGNVEAAIAALQIALGRNPKLIEAVLEMGNVYFAHRQWEDAIARYRYVLEQGWDSTEIWAKLGVALAETRQEKEAIAAFKKTLDLNSNLAPSIYQTMIGLLQQDKLNQTVSFNLNLPIETPLGYWETTEAYAIAHPDQCTYQQIFASEMLHLTPPKTSDGVIHFSFRFGDRIPLSESFVATIQNGRYWIDVDQTSSAVLTADNQLLADLSPEFPALSPGHPDKQPGRHWTFVAGKLASPKTIQGNVAVLSGLSNNVYFHWMFDILPRLELLKQGEFDFEAIDYFLINHQLPFQRESLEKFNIPPQKLLQVDHHQHIQASQLIVPSFPGTIAWMPNWVCDFLRSTFLEKPSSSEKLKRLYISRHRTQNRHVINEKAVVDLLSELGFETVYLESMAIAQQAHLFAQAEIIVAPHGSGLTNLVFCQPGTKVIELFSPNFVYSCYWLVSSLMDLDYRYLIGDLPLGKFTHQLLYPNPRIEDIFVNLEALSSLLRNV